MEFLPPWWDQIGKWFWEHPIERAVLCAETVALVIGGPWAWFTWRSNRRLLRSTQQQLRDLKGSSEERHLQLLAAVREIPGRPLEEQIRIAEEAGVRANWSAQEARWRQQMRNGQAAAELIMTAPTLADAKRVHVDFRATEGRMYPEHAHFAILHRLTAEEDMAAAGDAANEIALETEDKFMLDPESDEEAKALIALYEGRDNGLPSCRRP